MHRYAGRWTSGLSRLARPYLTRMSIALPEIVQANSVSWRRATKQPWAQLLKRWAKRRHRVRESMRNGASPPGCSSRRTAKSDLHWLRRLGGAAQRFDRSPPDDAIATSFLICQPGRPLRSRWGMSDRRPPRKLGSFCNRNGRLVFFPCLRPPHATSARGPRIAAIPRGTRKPHLWPSSTLFRSEDPPPLHRCNGNPGGMQADPSPVWSTAIETAMGAARTT
jgi:hypothetical protein